MVEQENARWNLGCTEFELLTATAYKIFELEKVQLALVEVGLGGLLDATNVLQPPSDGMGGVVACGITKIGIDHESFLGSTLPEIAMKKAGIIKPGVPVVVDGTNPPEVLETIRSKADQEGSRVVEATHDTKNLAHFLSFSTLVGAYQAQNLALALNIIKLLSNQNICVSDEIIEKGIRATTWPGRLQTIVDPETKLSMLLDGAHNEGAAVELGAYLRHKFRPNGLIFIVGMTNGKAADKIFLHLIERDVDTVYPVTFTAPENMSQVRCYTTERLGAIAQGFANDVRIEQGGLREIFSKLLVNRREGDVRDIVVFGSLYLCSDVLRSFATNYQLSSKRVMS